MGAKGIFVASPKFLRYARALHPVADKFGDIPLSFLFERGDQVIEIEATATPRGEHVSDGLVEHRGPVRVLQAIEEQQAFGADDSRIFGFAWSCGRWLRNFRKRT